LSRPVVVRPEFLVKRKKGGIAACPLCGEAYPLNDGGVCRFCQGEAPYADGPGWRNLGKAASPDLRAVPVEEAVGKRALHDMTLIVPGEKKGAEFTKGQEISCSDINRLQKMGRRSVYIEGNAAVGDEWVHENEAAEAFGKAMAGEGVAVQGPPSEGKVNLVAARDGLFLVEESRLEQFNFIPDVMCACRRGYGVVKKGTKLAGSRAIPLFLRRDLFAKCMSLLGEGPLFRVAPMRRAKAGILITGNEVYDGAIQDKFQPIIEGKVMKFGCEVVKTIFTPDDRGMVKQGAEALIEAGTDLLITTAGLSVDPDDVTRLGLIDAGASDVLYGAPILPGAMTLLAKIGGVQVFGVPACALFFKTTSFDLLLPRLLAGVPITRKDLVKLANGAMCHECKDCTYPKCSFGK
jgi:formylmethanofuran dehydrogenase subunit E